MSANSIPTTSIETGGPSSLPPSPSNECREDVALIKGTSVKLSQSVVQAVPGKETQTGSDKAKSPMVQERASAHAAAPQVQPAALHPSFDNAFKVTLELISETTEGLPINELFNQVVKNDLVSEDLIQQHRISNEGEAIVTKHVVDGRHFASEFAWTADRPFQVHEKIWEHGLKHEIGVMKAMRHRSSPLRSSRRLVRVLGLVDGGFAMEWFPRADAFTTMISMHVKELDFPHGARLYLAKSKIECVAKLELVGIVHGDIKVSNFFIRDADSVDVVLADFQTAGPVGSPVRGGTAPYCCKDQIRGKPLTHHYDRTALAVALRVVLGRDPNVTAFEGMNGTEDVLHGDSASLLKYLEDNDIAEYMPADDVSDLDDDEAELAMLLRLILDPTLELDAILSCEQLASTWELCDRPSFIEVCRKAHAQLDDDTSSAVTETDESRSATDTTSDDGSGVQESNDDQHTEEPKNPHGISQGDGGDEANKEAELKRKRAVGGDQDDDVCPGEEKRARVERAVSNHAGVGK